MKLWLKVIFGIEIAIFTFFCIVPITHECGHVLFGWATGYRLVELRITIPLFSVWDGNYVVMIGQYNHLFYLGGVLFDFIIGIVLILLNRVKFHFLFFSTGIAFCCDGIFYVIWSNITGCGDFVPLGIEISITYFIVTLAILVILFQYIYIHRRKSFL